MSGRSSGELGRLGRSSVADRQTRRVELGLVRRNGAVRTRRPQPVTAARSADLSDADPPADSPKAPEAELVLLEGLESLEIVPEAGTVAEEGVGRLLGDAEIAVEPGADLTEADLAPVTELVVG